MTGLALQIDGKWAVLDEDVSVSIEDNSPVWGDGNSFSLPFSLSVEANRHILGNSDQITGQSVYEVLDGRRAVLYTLGIPVYYGKIKMDDEVEIADGYVDVTLVSGNLTFDEMIDGMNCQDVELMDEIIVGEGIDYLKVQDTFTREIRTIYFPEDMMHMKVDGVSTINVSNTYPFAKYCNVRIAYQLPEKPSEQSQASKYYPDKETKFFEELTVTQGRFASYVALDADRPLSGLCFFVLYFLDCLFAKLGIMFDSSQLTTMEDMNRLSFFSTKCKCDLKDTKKYFTDDAGVQTIVPSFFHFGDGSFKNHKYHRSLYVANSKNFPNEEVGNVISALENGFGVRFLHDTRNNTVTATYIKDILRDTEILNIRNVEIYEATKTENNIKGLKIQYSGSDEENTSFNYSDWKRLDTSKGYADIKKEVYGNNRTVYIDKKTGDAYRIKVDEEAETEKDLNPVLVEVAEFIPVEYGDCSSEDNMETIEIPFTPIIQNDIQNGESDFQTFATFLDLSMQYPSFVPMTTYDLWWTAWGGDVAFEYSYFSAQRTSSSSGSKTVLDLGVAPLKRENENSLFDYEAGLTLGIMRGPGRNAGIEDYEQNYDGENNYKYVAVGQDYAFHSDTLDNYGRLFDYNGTESGGVDTEGRFSLKLKAEKPVLDKYKELGTTYEEYYAAYKEWGLSDEDINSAWNTLVADTEYYKKYGYYPISETYAQKRGLFDKFYTEYAYFVVNRKIVKMVCRMEMADVLNIDWTKRYKIGDYTGFINKYSYTVDSTGMSDVTLEMYYI